MKPELQDCRARLKRYDNIDGTGEMFIGLMILGFTFLAYVQDIVPKNSMWRRGCLAVLFMYMILIPALALGYWGVSAIKKHITWPRTGYVTFRSGSKTRWTGLTGIAAVGAIVGAGLVGCLLWFERRHDWVTYGWINKTICVATYALWIYHMEKSHPWKWLLVAVMALGPLALAWIARGEIARGEVPALQLPNFLLVGLTWLASGAITLCLYIRHTQAPAPEVP